MAVTELEVVELYVATFNRAPDAAGLAYWVNDSGLTIEQIAQSFFDQEETQDLYPEGTTDEEFVNSIYQNLFGRDADEEGLAYWTGEDGLGGTMTRDVMILALENGAQGDDATIIANKAEVGLYYAEQGLEGTDYSLASVTVDADTVTAAKADIDTYVPQTITLTAGAETVTGGNGDDTIIGVSSALSSARTLDATDTIDGAAGTDTLTVDMQSNFTGFTTGSLANVENIELTNEGTVARTFTGTGITGADQYTLTGAVNLAGLTEIDTVVSGARTAALSIAYASTVTDGTADSLSLMVTDNGTADDATTTANEEVAVAVTVAGIETVDLTAEGTNVLDLSAVAAKALTATGSGSLKVTALNAATKTIDASGVEGSVNLNLTGISAGTSVATGAGDDVVVVDVNDDLTANAIVSGGEGADTLIVTAASADTIQYTQTGFETVAFGAQAGILTMSLKNTSDVNTLVALGSASTAGDLDQDVTLAGAGSGDYIINIQGANATAPVLSSDHTGATTIVVDTPATTATTTAPTSNDVDVTLTGSTSVDLSVASKMSWAGTVTASKASSVEVALEGVATGATIDAAAATSVAFTAVNAVSDLTLTAAAVTDLTVANAKDLDLTGSTLTALESLTASGAGDLNLTGVALGALNNATISNTGDVDLNNTGGAALDYATTVVSTGAATFDIGTMTTNNQNITLAVTDAVGAVTAGAIAAGTGNVNVTVSGGGTMVLDAITGKGVTVDASGVLGAVTYGGDITLTGNLTFVGSELQDNDMQTQDIVLAGTAQTLSLTGGIGDDIFDVVGAATTTSITITGDLDIGTNDITIDNTANTEATSTITIAGLSNYDTASISLDATSVETVTLGAGVDTVVLAVANASGDKIGSFTGKAGGDVMNLTALATFAGTAIYEEGSATSNSTIAGAEVIGVTDNAAADWSDVLTIMNAAIDTTGVVTTDTAIAISNGTDTRIYVYEDDTNAAAIEAAELTSYITLTGVDVDAGTFVAGNFVL